MEGLEINILAVVAITVWATVAYVLVDSVCTARGLALNLPWYLGVPVSAAIGYCAYDRVGGANAWPLGLMFVGLSLAVWTDLRFGLILDATSWPTLAVVAVAVIFQGSITSALIGALVLASFFGVVFLVTRGAGMGLGDVKIALSVGAAFEWPDLSNCMAGIAIVALVIAVPMFLARRKGEPLFGREVVFGPFIGAGATLAVVLGSSLSQFLSHVG